MKKKGADVKTVAGGWRRQEGVRGRIVVGVLGEGEGLWGCEGRVAAAVMERGGRVIRAS